MRSQVKSVLKFLLPLGAGPVLRRWRKRARDALLGLPSRLRLAGSHDRLFCLNLARRDRRVVFVSEIPSQREAKLAFGLKRAGWDVIQLYRDTTKLSDFSSVAEARRFDSPWQAVEMAHHAESRLFHAFSWAGDETCLNLLSHKPGRVVADFYDYAFAIADGVAGREETLAGQIALQYRCAGLADMLCCRDLQLQYRRRDTRLGEGKKLILFPEYCWDQEELPPPRNDGEVHIVQVGTMGFETLGQPDLGCFLVIRPLVEAGCHVHIYMHPFFPPVGTPAFARAFADYLELGARTGRVHLHPTLPVTELTREMRQYDFGFNLQNGLNFPVEWKEQNPRRLPFCGSSRTYDYLEAGLTLLIDRGMSFMYRSFRDRRVVMDGGELLRAPDILAKLRQRPSRGAILAARQALSIDGQIHRLIKAYEDLS